MTTYADIRADLRSGDILLFANQGWISNVGRSEYSHAEMVVRHKGPGSRETVLTAGVREFQGGRIKTLSSQVRDYPGKIDVYRATCSQAVAALAADFAVRQAGHAYSYAGILKLGLLHAPILRQVFRWFPDITNMNPTAWDAPKFCSQLVVWCYRAAVKGFRQDWELVNGLADWAVEPGDLRRGSVQQLWRGLEL